MQYQKTTCDGCGTDLSHDGDHGRKWSMSLRADFILPPKGGDWSPGESPLSREFHFCSIKCIDDWCVKGGK